MAARNLGWASLGIGVAEIAVPRQIAQLLGIDERTEHLGLFDFSEYGS